MTQRLTLACGLAIGGSAGIANGQVAVTTQHNDNGRTGQNLTELVLNTSNVNVNAFGKLFSRPVDGQIYAQPLYVPHLSIAGQIRNVVYVATQNDTVYAFDADDPAASLPLWHINVGTPVPSTDVAPSCADITPQIGITSTPVIDTSSSTIYVVAKTKNTSDNSYHFKIHALDLITGGEKFGGPTEITAQVPGTGIASVGGTVTLDPLQQFNRPGLLLLNGVVYVAFGSACETPPWHGWILGYSASTLQKVAVLNTTPNGSDGGIWAGGQGLLADSANIYVMTGNGTFDPTTSRDYGDSVLKISTASSLSIVDYFTPTNQAALDAADLDLGSGGPMALPGTNLIVGSGKDGVVRVLDTANLGQFSATTNNNLQNFQGTTGFVFMGAPIYWNSPNHGPVIYIWSGNDFLKAYQLVNKTFQTTPVSQGTILESPGLSNSVPLSLSANGNQAGTGIVWGSGAFSGNANQSTVSGILRAFDATDLTNELWDSKQNAARDDVGNYAKFSPPTIANGKVYQATFSNQLAVYGLLAPVLPAPTVAMVNPAAGTQGMTNLNVVLTGTNFVSGATCSFGAGIHVNSCTVNSATQISVNIDLLASAATTPARDVAVTNPDGQIGTLLGGFSVTGGIAAPTVTITPAGTITFPNTVQSTASAPIAVTVTNSGSAALTINAITFAGTNAGDFSLAANTTCAITGAGATVAASSACIIGVTFTPGAVGLRQVTLQIGDNASGSPQRVALSGNGTPPAAPAVTITPSATVTFPAAAQGTASAPITITVKNSGTATLNITTVTFAGANAIDFALASGNCAGATVAANATCTVGVTFTPGATGARQAILQITDNATGSPQSVVLSGTGTASTPTNPAVTITPSAVSMTATEGTTSGATNVTVSNSGNAPLHITGVTYGGANVSEFVNPAGPCTAAVAPTASCTISLSFAPVVATGNRTEIISIMDNAANSPHTVAVTGTTSPAFAVTSASTALAAAVTAGQTATYTLQLTPGAGYSGNVTMACSGAPALAACAVTPNPIVLKAGSAANFTVSVTTTARSFLIPYSDHRTRSPSLPISPPNLLIVAVGLCLAVMAAVYRRYDRRNGGAFTQRQLAYSGFLFLILVAHGLAGCASAGISTPPTPQTGTAQGTYTITLTPTASSMTGQPLQTTPVHLTLTVN